MAGSACHVEDDLFCRILDAVMRNLARAEGIQTDHAAENETSLVMALRGAYADSKNQTFRTTPLKL